MNFLSNIRLRLIFGLFFAVLLGSCQKEINEDILETGDLATVNARFEAVVDNAPLEVNIPYENRFAEIFAVKAFKFYVSRIHLVNTELNTRSEISAEHFLIDGYDQNTLKISFKIRPAEFNAIAFTLGVDSFRNTSGAQTGALDPSRGMFWTWNTGYIMAKLEGISPLSSQPNNVFEYHIGGFRDQENVVKKLVVNFPLFFKKEFSAGSTNTVTLRANINKWFYGSGDIQIKTTPVCTTPGDLAKKIAGNYADMFTVVKVEPN